MWSSPDEMRKDDTTNGLRNFFTSTISDIEIVNDYELIMRMSRVDSTLLLNISEGENGFEIRSKSHFDQIGPPTMESGPLPGQAPISSRSGPRASTSALSECPTSTGVLLLSSLRRFAFSGRIPHAWPPCWRVNHTLPCCPKT